MNPLSGIVIVLLVGVATAANVSVPCIDGQVPNYIEARIFNDGVECTESPCALKRGTDVSGEVIFTAAKDIESIVKFANATILGLNTVVPYPLPGADKGCDDLLDGSYCPLDRGERARLSISMPILQQYPKISLKIALFLKDQDNEEITCFAFLCDVVD